VALGVDDAALVAVGVNWLMNMNVISLILHFLPHWQLTEALV